MPKRIATVIAIAVVLVMATEVAMAANVSGKTARETSLSTQKSDLETGRRLRHRLRLYQQITWHRQDLLLVPRSPGKRSGRQLQSIGYLNWAVGLWKQRAAQARHHVQHLLASRGYLPPSRARVLGHVMAAKLYGWSDRQWGCLDEVWGKLESGWRVLANNPHSEAYGIPQALPGSKMASAGKNWQKSAHVQIAWGLKYIKGRYRTACGALSVRLTQHSY